MGDQEECIICSTDLIASSAVVKKQKDQGNMNGMKYQVRTVFVLRKLLEISNSTCCELLQFGNPSSWLSYCFECFETVIEAEKIFSKLMKLESKWTDLKKSVEKKICKQKCSSQVSRKSSNAEKFGIIRRIRKEAVDRLQSVNPESIGIDPFISTEIKIESNENFDEYVSSDVNEDRIAGTQNDANSVLQNTKTQEQDYSLDEITTERVEHKQSKVGKRTRSGRLTMSKYGSNLNYGSDNNDNDDYEPNHDLDYNEDSNLLEKPAKRSKTFPCSACNRVFETSYGLHYHRLRYHGTDAEKPFHCKICGLGMYAERSLSRHIEKQHPGNSYKLCHRCLLTFFTKTELLNHVCEVKVMHKIQAFECKKCKKEFTTAEHLEEHIKSHECFDECGSDDLNDYQSNEEKDTALVEKTKKIPCPQCDRVFSHQHGLRYHQLRYHGADSEKPFRCEICGMGMHSIRSLSRHTEKQHSGNDHKRCCNKCSVNFNTKSELMNHICEAPNKPHIFDKPFKCHKCPRTFSSLKRRKCHTLQIHVSGKEKPYPCRKCGSEFLSRKNLHYHELRKHNGPSVKVSKVNSKVHTPHRERNVPCPQCDFVFTSEDAVERHIRQIHDPNFSIPCPMCTKPFSTTIGMKKHVTNVHHKEKNFICEICSKSFTYASTLRYHQMSEHEKSEELKCKICDHFSADPFSLRKHIAVVHNKGSLKFKCPVCSHVALSQSRLNGHILNRHTNEKPYVCSECDKAYKNNNSLKIHMLSHTGERPFECQFCQKTFCTKSKKNRHEEDMHSTGKPYQCEKCGKNFPSKHYLQTHDYDVHRKRQKDAVPDKVLINEELLKEAISQSTAEIVKTNAVGLFLEKSLQKSKDT